MDANEFAARRRFVDTRAGRIAYVEKGNGPAALFFHGAFLNGYQWRDVIDGCAGVRRCIAFDNLGHGATDVAPGQAVDVEAQAEAARDFLDALGIDSVDIVGNDSGGAIAQFFAVRYPERVRTMTLTNCDVHDNNPSEEFRPIIELARSGARPALVERLLSDPALARSKRSFGGVYEDPMTFGDEAIDVYLRPLVRSPEAADAFARFIASLGACHTVRLESSLRSLEAPTLIAWGTADTTFPLQWAVWLQNTLPNARPVAAIEGAKLFWPEERPAVLSALLREHWSRA